MSSISLYILPLIFLTENQVIAEARQAGRIRFYYPPRLTVNQQIDDT
jgi:hypothetical protein